MENSVHLEERNSLTGVATKYMLGATVASFTAISMQLYLPFRAYQHTNDYPIPIYACIFVLPFLLLFLAPPRGWAKQYLSPLTRRALLGSRNDSLES